MDYEEFLKDKYNKSALSVEELSEEIGVSKRMIVNRVNACSEDVPSFIKIGRKTVFPIKEVAKFLNNVVKVA